MNFGWYEIGVARSYYRIKPLWPALFAIVSPVTLCSFSPIKVYHVGVLPSIANF